MIERLTKVTPAHEGLRVLAEKYERGKLQCDFLPAEKTELDTIILTDAHSMMVDYLDYIGVDAVKFFGEELVILSPEIRKAYPLFNGYYKPPFIYIPTEAREDPRQYLDTLIHETYHQSSFHYDALPACTRTQGTRQASAVGLHITNIDTQNKKFTYFLALNEAITQELTVNTLKHSLAYTNRQERYGLVVGPYEMDKKIYSNERRLLWTILERVAETKNLVPSQVFKLFVQSYFNGTLGAISSLLRDAYGNEALDRLANIPLCTPNEKPWSGLEATGDPNVDFFFKRPTW